MALKDCLRAIKDNAFFASEYPVVITFEDHLTSALQAKVAMVVQLYYIYIHKFKWKHGISFISILALNGWEDLRDQCLCYVWKMVTKMFGDMLYCPESDYLVEFPSPEALKKRVMISTKPPEHRESTHHNRSTSAGTRSTSSTTSTSTSSGFKQNSKDSEEDDEQTADDKVYLSN